MTKEQPNDHDRLASSAEARRGRADIPAARSYDVTGVGRQPFRSLELPPIGFPYPFRRELTACIELLHFAKEKLDNAQLELKDTASQVVGIHYVRAANTYEAILHLALDGFGAQAELLIRPLFELALTATWVSRNPAATERRYDLHRRYALSLWNARKEKSGIYRHENRREILTPAEKKEAKRLFGSYAERGWTGKSLREMAKEFSSSHDVNDGGQVHWQAYMDVVHPLINWAMHSTGVGDLRVAAQETTWPS